MNLKSTSPNSLTEAVRRKWRTPEQCTTGEGEALFSTFVSSSRRNYRGQGPGTPQGGCTGVLVPEMEGRGPFFSFGGMATYTPQKYAQSTQLVERITMVTLFFRKDSISRFFLFFCRKNFVVDEKSTFHHHYHFSSDHTSTSFIDIHMGFHFL